MSYFTITNKKLKSIYKFYYTKNIVKNLITKDKTDTTTFLFYGTIRPLSPLKRIVSNKDFNTNNMISSVKLSIIPYSNFKSLIRFSNLSMLKIRLKGNLFFQIEVVFHNKFFSINKTSFRIHANIFNNISTIFEQSDIKINSLKGNSIFPSIIFISSKDEATSFIRYTSIQTWINQVNTNLLDYKMIYIFNYNQNIIISVLLYNQNLKFTSTSFIGLIA